MSPSSTKGLGPDPPPCPRAAGERGLMIEYYGREKVGWGEGGRDEGRQQGMSIRILPGEQWRETLCRSSFAEPTV